MYQFAVCVISYQVQSYVKYISDTQQLYVADLLLWKSVNVFFFLSKKVFFQATVSCLRLSEEQSDAAEHAETIGLIELLQKSAVEYLSTFQQFQAQYLRQIGSLFTIVTTDFEAL